MILKKLKIKDFRSYKDLELEFSPGGGVFSGSNAAGKTNILDAIYFLAFLHSRRASKDEESIRWGEPGFYLMGEIERSEEFFHRIEVSVYRDCTKKLKINSKIKTKFPSAEEGLKVVAFYPDDFSLISSTPLSRRRFLNVEISQIDAPYRLFLRQYQEILNQRNTALKRIRNKRCGIDELSPWGKQLIDVGIKIIKKRMDLVEEMSHTLKEIHNFLTDGRECLKLQYICSLGNGNEKPVLLKGLEDKFRQSLLSLQAKEVALGMTLSGPHRDDIVFFINDINASIYGSHAQQRTMAVSLRLAWAQLMTKILEEPPVVLLDDVLSELDGKRRTMLLDFLQSHKMQCFITGTSAQQFKNNLKKVDFFEVSGGTINKTAI